MRLECTLKKQASVTSSVVLRKYYQVVFWNDDFRSFDVYTGVVLGSDEGIDDKFSVEIEYDVKIGDRGQHAKFDIIHEDVTDKFLEQEAVWKFTWGKDSEYKDIKDGSLNEVWKEINARFNGKTLKELTNFVTPNRNKLILIRDKSKGKRDDLISLAYRPDAHITVASRKYNVQIESGRSLLPGIEIINWTKTHIEIETKNRSVAANEMEYRIQFKNLCKTNEVKFESPDLTLFFVLPTKYEVILDETWGRAKLINNNKEIEEPNPLQKMKYLEKAYFDEWKSGYTGSARKVYKARGELFKDSGSISDLRISLAIESPKIEGWIQFSIGMFLSVLFAFGLDQGRLDQNKAAFLPIRPESLNDCDCLAKTLKFIDSLYISQDIQWVLMSGVIFLMYMLRVVKVAHDEPQPIRFMRRLIWGLFLVWFVLALVFKFNSEYIRLIFLINILIGTSTLLLAFIFADKYYYVSLKKWLPNLPWR